MSWCPSDPALVVSSGSDQRTVVTNFNTGEFVLDFAGAETANNKLNWSKFIDGKVASMDS